MRSQLPTLNVRLPTRLKMMGDRTAQTRRPRVIDSRRQVRTLTCYTRHISVTIYRIHRRRVRIFPPLRRTMLIRFTRNICRRLIRTEFGMRPPDRTRSIVRFLITSARLTQRFDLFAHLPLNLIYLNGHPPVHAENYNTMRVAPATGRIRYFLHHNVLMPTPHRPTHSARFGNQRIDDRRRIPKQNDCRLARRKTTQRILRI